MLSNRFVPMPYLAGLTCETIRCEYRYVYHMDIDSYFKAPPVQKSQLPDTHVKSPKASYSHSIHVKLSTLVLPQGPHLLMIGVPCFPELKAHQVLVHRCPS